MINKSKLLEKSHMKLDELCLVQLQWGERGGTRLPYFYFHNSDDYNICICITCSPGLPEYLLSISTASLGMARDVAHEPTFSLKIRLTFGS